MAHKTLIGGTTYDITGGKARVNGTTYDIKSGRTLIGGTGYDVKLAGIQPVFGDNDWGQIITACQTNTVPETWAVGDSAPMTINGTEYQIDIIGKNHDTYSGGGTAPLTFQLHDCYATTYAIMSSGYQSFWQDTTMYKTYLPQIKALMPAEVQSAIRTVNKYYTYATTATASLFLLSLKEITGSAAGSGDRDDTRYEYYQNGGSLQKYTVNTTTSADWWTRTLNNTSMYYRISTTGKTGGESQNNKNGVSFAFCF